MALKESNPDQAAKILASAQGLGGDIDFWFAATNILAECLMLKREDSERFSKARHLIHTALDEFETLTMIQPNKQPSIEVMMAKLELKLALIEYEHIMTGSSNSASVSTMQPKIHGALIGVVKRLEKVAQVFNRARKFMDEIYTVLQICHLYR